MEGFADEVVLDWVIKQDEMAMAELYRRVRNKHAALAGQPINVSEAARKYGMPTEFWRGVIKAGRVEVLKAGQGGRGNASELDARDVAVYWELYNLLRDQGYTLNKVYRAANTQLIAA